MRGTVKLLVVIGLIVGNLYCFFVPQLHAGTCASIFSSALQNSTDSGHIAIYWNGQVLNDPDNQLETAHAITFNSAGVATCGSVDCTASGNSAAGVILPVFKTTTTAYDVDLPYGYGTYSLDNQSYLKIRSNGNGTTIRDNGAYSEYYISELDLGYQDQLVLQGGHDYWIEKFIFSTENSIIVEGNGTARLFINSDLNMTWDGRINSGGSVEKLLIVGYGAINYKVQDNQSRLLLYGAGDVRLANNSYFEGAIAAAGDITLLASDARVVYSPSGVTSLDGGAFCEGGATSPEAFYHFDESAWYGNANEIVDSSGNDYHATAVNGVTTKITSPAVPGNPGTCAYADFDGDNDYVSLPASYPNLTSDFTITAWIRTRNNARGHQRIFIDDPNNSQGIGFSVADGGTGQVRFFSRSTNPISLDTSAVIQNDTWYFVAAVADISHHLKKIYVYDQSGNQLTVASGSYTGSWGYDSGSASIGGENILSAESTYRFEGNIDEVRVHEGALDVASIEALQAETHYCLTPPVAEYRFDLCTETDVIIDDSGNGFDGTVQNGPLEIGAGKVCNAAIFDGVDDYITIDDQDQFDDTDVLTISGWMNPLSIRNPPPTGNARGVISKRNAPSDQAAFGVFFYSVLQDGKLYVDLDTENNRFSSNSAIPEDTWTHFAVVFDGNLPENERAKIYINGVLDRTAKESSTRIPGYNSDLHIGNLYYGPSQLKVFKGLLDEINVSRTALSAQEVSYLYTSSQRNNCQVCSETDLDHLRIEHLGSGLTCSPTEVVVRACADSDCAVAYTDPVYFTMTPVTGQPGWVGGAAGTMVGESAYINLRQTTPATVTLGVTNISPVPNHGYTCYDNGVAGDCDISFYDSGFIFNVPDHVSATTQNVTLAAVRKDPTSEQCVPGFANVSRSLAFSYGYTDPATGSMRVNINGTDVAAGGTNVKLSFNNNGESSLALKYPDVGQVHLVAAYSGTSASQDAGLTMTGEDQFITRPDHFSLTIPGNPAAADAFGAVFTKAGAAFKVEVSARNADDKVTPNYGIEAVPEGVSLTSALVAPADQNNPSLAGSFEAFGTDCEGGSASGYACGTFSWPEVGIITLSPQVKDGSYLETGKVVGRVSEPVGRFIPAYFSLSEASSPEFSDACGSGGTGFTYLGQPFGYLIDPRLQVTAETTGRATVGNYGGFFWKLSSSWAGRSYAHYPEDPTLFVGIVTKGSVSLSGDKDYDGQGLFVLSGETVVYDKPTAAVAPFATSINLTLTTTDLTDSDNVCYDVNSDGVCDPYTFSTIGKTEQRFGLLQLWNAYGPETLPLTIPATTEYYKDGAFIANIGDSCTTINSANLQLTKDPGSLVSAASGSGSFASGSNGTMVLSAPGAGNSGTVDVVYDLDIAGLKWLKNGAENPKARASFGLFQGNPRLIYTRESVW